MLLASVGNSLVLKKKKKINTAENTTTETGGVCFWKPVPPSPAAGSLSRLTGVLRPVARLNTLRVFDVEKKI